MARPLRIEFPGAFYHVIQRGMERKDIFASDNDKKKFLSYLNAAHMSYRAVFHAYVLMNNHYHLILETPHAPLSKIMHYINSSYAIYFNIKRRRSGPLYQGRFKAFLVQQDEYLHYLSCYVHLNPVRAGLVKSPGEYAFSSYNVFTSDTKPPAWLNTSPILSMFDKRESKAKNMYRRFVIENIGREKDIIRQNTQKGLLLGNDNFFAYIKEKFIDAQEDSEIPILKEIKVKIEPPMEDIKSITEQHVPNDKKLIRSLSIYLSRKYTQKTLKEIANFYGGIKYTGVSQVWRRMEMRKGKDIGMAQLLAKLETEIMKCVM
jgi:REP element-mobilizing transposase RayT